MHIILSGEDFLSDSDWVSVATRSCTPVECDFPRQLCMRPSGKFNDESTNQCRNIPETCITAANNGVPLGTSAPKLVPSTTTPTIPSLILTIATKPPLPIPEPSPLLPPITIPSTVEVTALPIGPVLPETFGINICELGLPQGRFCGFLEKFAYNRLVSVEFLSESYHAPLIVSSIKTAIRLSRNLKFILLIRVNTQPDDDAFNE
ncbi:unnamed protein product [Anisakis simplex]|uniref:Uncharacterized protein n=1 Tax=Anisakis simplex TaxID=6269 RepID=A0A0M3J8V6_ANISI|nr:unnamed protein product [Anisakis simplex]